MRPNCITVEVEVARLAAVQNGLVTRSQLLHLGMSAAGIQRRLRKASLIAEFWGVYSLGHQGQSIESRYMAAVLACGDRAVLSGRAAAYLLGIARRKPPMPEVTVQTVRRVEGVTTRRNRFLDPRDTMRWRRVPVTTPARTLVDLAAVLDPAALARAVHEAGIVRGTRPGAIEAVLARRPRSPGAAKLRAVLYGDVNLTLSKLESRFLEVIRDAGLLMPLTNKKVGRSWIDCRWPAQRLTVELDGYRSHASRHAWENDRRREREARARGDEFRRYTFGDVFEDPRQMLNELRGLVPRR